jgi:hypothetical protein
METAVRILEGGDISLLDPLPPEQRAFLKEVIELFESHAAHSEPVARAQVTEPADPG